LMIAVFCCSIEFAPANCLQSTLCQFCDTAMTAAAASPKIDFILNRQ
jgi:hypothetical protein